ncbi:MAG: hypothetical protein ACI9MR_002355, partial [Myxococcota bacterium]
MRAVSLSIGILSLVVALASVPACGHDDTDGSVTDTLGVDTDGNSDTGFGTVAFDSGATTDGSADSAQPIDTGTIEDSAIATDGSTDTDTDTDTSSSCDGFGCRCNGNSDCLNELCIEGIDGRVCTSTCVASCPDGFDCINSTSVGPDAISICVPRHTRLCRPCRQDSDCAASDDPFPAFCLPAANPDDGSFCSSGCANRPCPEGFACEEVTLPTGGNARQCVPEGGATCSCRPAWDGAGFVTDCGVPNAFGTCVGSRSCGANGLTACDGPQ